MKDGVVVTESGMVIGDWGECESTMRMGMAGVTTSRLEFERVMQEGTNEFTVAAMKHKTVDKKVQPVAVPLPSEAGLLWGNESRKPDKTIGTEFTPERLAELHIGQEGFLTEQEDKEWQ